VTLLPYDQLKGLYMSILAIVIIFNLLCHVCFDARQSELSYSRKNIKRDEFQFVCKMNLRADYMPSVAVRFLV